jgi:HD domain
VAESWYTVGPALVVCLAGATSPDWTIYLGALGAQFAFDFVASVAHLGVGLRMRVRPVANELVAIYSVDALLAPVGLLAAFAAATEPWASLLVLPLLGLIAIFAREREARIESVLTLRDACRGTAHLLGEVLATTHEYTGSHSRSLVVIARQVGVSLGVSELVLREIEFGALLHDVGKMAVPNEILNKPAALTDDEMRTVRRHTLEGERMLERIGGMLGEMGPSCATTTSASTAPATRTGSGARRSRSPRA